MDAMEPGIIAFDTPLGTCAVRWTGRGIASVRLPGPRVSELPHVSDRRGPVPAAIRMAIDGIVGVLEGRAPDVRSIALDEAGIDSFRRQVYAATRTIRPGTTATYGEIARSIGAGPPDGARAVGAALARNPFPILVPCHRVVAANGALTGFSAPGGIATKRRMLELEGAPGFGQLALFG